MPLEITHNYGNAMLHAKRLVNGLTNPNVTECYRVKYAKIHLTDYIKCPTRAALARHNALKGVDIKSSFYKEKALMLDIHPEIIPLYRKLKAKLKIYKKTQFARNFIINTDRIAFGKINKRKHNFQHFLFKYFGI